MPRKKRKAALNSDGTFLIDLPPDQKRLPEKDSRGRQHSNRQRQENAINKKRKLALAVALWETALVSSLSLLLMP